MKPTTLSQNDDRNYLLKYVMNFVLFFSLFISLPSFAKKEFILETTWGVGEYRVSYKNNPYVNEIGLQLTCESDLSWISGGCPMFGSTIAIHRLYGTARSSHGTAALTSDSVTFKPKPNWCGNAVIAVNATAEHDGVNTYNGIDFPFTSKHPASFNITIPVECSPGAPLISNVQPSYTLAPGNGQNSPEVDVSDIVDFRSSYEADIDVITQPEHGTVSATDVYRRAAIKYHSSYCVKDSFTFVATNEFGSTQQTINIDYTKNCRLPPLQIETPPLSVKSGSILTHKIIYGGNNTDYQITYFSIQSKQGSGTFNGDTFTYTPPANFCGTVYADTNLEPTDPAYINSTQRSRFSITITCGPEVPTLNPTALVTTLNTAVTVTPPMNLDGADITDSLFTPQAVNGLASWSNNQLTYVPNTNFCGTDQFSTSITTEGGTSNIVEFQVQVNCPVLAAQSIITNEDTPKSITVAVTVDTSAITAHKFTANPSHGVASFNNSTKRLTYTPAANYCGADSLTMTVTASSGESVAKTFPITVDCINDAPSIFGVSSVMVKEDTAYAFTPIASDVDAGDTKVFTIDNKPSWATFSATTGRFSGTPSTQDVGITNNIVISVRDKSGSIASLPAFSLTVINLTYASINNSLSCGIDSNANSYFESSEVLACRGSNPSYCPLNPTQCTASEITYTYANKIRSCPAGLTYFPNPGVCNGPGHVPVSPSYSCPGGYLSYENTCRKATGGGNPTCPLGNEYSCVENGAKSYCSTQTCQTNSNYMAVLNAKAITVIEDSTKTIALAVTVDPSSIAAHNFTKKPANGTASFNNITKNLTYTPDPNYCGTDTLSMTVSTERGISNTAKFPITINCVNDAPVINTPSSQTVDMAAGKTTAYTVTDVDSNTITATLTNSPSFITLNHSNKNGNIVVSNKGVAGTYNVTLTVSDGALTTSKTIAITLTDHRPVLAAQSIITNEDTPKSITAAVTVDTSAITAHKFTANPTHGVASFNNATKRLTYTPAANYCGADSLTMTVTASSGESVAKTFPITVNCVNDAPVITIISNHNIDMAIGKSISYTVTDIDSNTTTATLTGNPEFVSLNHKNKNGNIIVSNQGVAATYRVTLTVSDGRLSASKDVTMTITDYRPVLAAESINLNEDTTKTITTRVTVDTSAITGHNFITSPTHGVATFHNATKKLTYTPNADYCGSDSITMSVTASKGTSIAKTFPITVNCVDEIPVISNYPVRIEEDSNPISFRPAHNSFGIPVLLRDITRNANNGLAHWDGTQLTYQPNKDYCGSDSFSYRIKTNGGYSNTAVASIEVNCVNDSPVISVINNHKVDISKPFDIGYSVLDVDNTNVTATLKFVSSNVGSSMPSFITLQPTNKSGKIDLSSTSKAGSYQLLLSVTDGLITVETPIKIDVEDNRDIIIKNGELTSIPAQTILRNKQNKPNNALYATGIKDKLGSLITGQVKLTIDAASDSVPARVEGYYVGQGERVIFDYDITKPGVIEVHVEPQTTGRAIISMNIETK